MEHSTIFSDQRFKIAIIASGALTLVYVLINLFVIGGDGFVITLNDTTVIPLAILTTISAYILLNQVKASGNGRLLWGGLFAGWALWTIAEIVWAVYGYFSQEVPYPSPADFFWLIGYIPLGFGLYSRLREMPVKPNTSQKLALWGSSLATIFITMTFVILPIFQEYDASHRLESIISIIYPLADLLLLIIVLRLLFIYRSGDYGFGWNLLITGFVLMTISDLVFAYAIPLDLYYPEQKVNLISSLGNSVPYNLSYLLWIFGIYALRLTLSKQHPFETIIQPKLVPNAHILISTKADETVISLSNNFNRIFGADSVKRKSIAELLQIPEHKAQSILAEIRNKGTIADQPIPVINRSGVPQETYLSGRAIIYPQDGYSGCSLVLRTFVEGDYTLDEDLDTYQKSMILYLQKISGSGEEAEIGKLLLDYYSAYLKQLYNLIFHTGGAQLSLVFLERLQQTAKEHQWPLQFDSRTLLTNSEYPLSVLREALPVLLETAKHFASHLTDANTVEIEMQSVSSQFSEAVHSNVAYYSKQDWL